MIKKNIDELERLVNIEKFLEQNHIEFFDTGPQYRFSCPLHSESDNITSAIFYKDTHFFRCFADTGCSNGTSIPLIQFISKYFKHKKFIQSKKWLEQFTGIKAKINKSNKSNNNEKFNIGIFVPKPTIDNTIIEKKYSLFFNKASHEYIEYYTDRRISKDTRKYFDIRYRKDFWMKNRIVFPLKDEYGKTIAYSGRYICDNDIGNIDEELSKLLKKTIIIGKYKNSPENILKTNILYNLHNVKYDNRIFIVEGFFDVWRLYEYGLSAVAIMGSSISEIQAYLLMKYFKDKEVFLYFDGDKAGYECLSKSYDNLNPYLKYLYKIYTPFGMDTDLISKSKTFKLINEAA